MLALARGARRSKRLSVSAAAAAEGEGSQVANDNAPGQIVISGSENRDGSRGKACARGQRHPGARCSLPVSAPFHCALMQPAAAIDERTRSKR